MVAKAKRPSAQQQTIADLRNEIINRENKLEGVNAIVKRLTEQNKNLEKLLAERSDEARDLSGDKQNNLNQIADLTDEVSALKRAVQFHEGRASGIMDFATTVLQNLINAFKI